MSDNISCLTNQFLISMPAMDDPFFYRAVTYICEHNENGAIGIIINRALDFSLNEVFEQMLINNVHDAAKTLPVHFGGPVQQERGFVLHRPSGNWRSSLDASKEITITTSQDILEAIAIGEGPEEFFVALGYAGWGEQQLETELTNNSWLNCPANTDVLFHTPLHKRWEAAAALIGVDINALSGDIGHA